MVNLTVVFESLTTTQTAPSELLLNKHEQSDGQALSRTELINSFEHGLQLLLNAADLDLEVRAIMFVDACALTSAHHAQAAATTTASGTSAAATTTACGTSTVSTSSLTRHLSELMGEELIRKMGQLDLYDIPCMVLDISAGDACQSQSGFPGIAGGSSDECTVAESNTAECCTAQCSADAARAASEINAASAVSALMPYFKVEGADQVRAVMADSRHIITV
ncbi:MULTISPECIES: hypothetical protein [unclassified Anaerobiospirillum]|uniref:hypothetical protein n=1 Tax=unclassified Anaerobiospirillum TaxID=2647410 RepID=UPI001FF11093|nr:MULTISPECIES: hypothetical protein [unclassified Anaerobiospirillum]MCK0535122.1 hypothetical protein [Anaerobiospirillum sp. NML120511]MCK0540948.1 hypothetical protein [Anaerobiospirillum sp. NML02-A-032]